MPLESNMKLWWPHTEAIYATTLAYSLIVRDKALFSPGSERIDAYAFAHFSDPEHGEWFAVIVTAAAN